MRSFHYESDGGKFTARKEGRDSSRNEYWYAYRKIHSKLRKVYLGAMDELTSDRLEQVAVEISQSPQDYYYSRKGYTTKKEQSCVTVDKTSTNIPSLALESKGYPTNGNADCVTNSSELKALQDEVEQLRSELIKVNLKYEVLSIEKRQLEDGLSELADKVRSKHKGYKDNGFSQGIKYIVALADSKGL